MELTRKTIADNIYDRNADKLNVSAFTSRLTRDN